MADWPSPAYRIATPRCVVRAYDRGDVDDVHEGVRENVEALRPWMPWVADEPMNRTQRAELLRRFRGELDLGQNYVYGVFDAAGAYVGGTGLHPRSTPHMLEIGYWITASRWGEGLATEVAAAMTQIGLRWMAAERIEIRVSPDNAPSARVAEKLGYRREGVLRGIGPVIDGAPAQDLIVFGMMADELPGSPADAVSIEAQGFAT